MGTEVKADWPAGIVGASSTGGALYGFPNEIDVYALNYNKKLFEAAGIAAPPTTWDEFIADAKKLTDKSKGQQGFGMINSWAAGVIHPFASLLASNGGELVADGKPELDSEAAKETFELYEKLVKEGLADPAMGTSDANTTGPFLDNFVSGKTGMIIMANWWESALKSGMGDKFADIATAPIPVGPARRQAAFDLLFVDDRGQRQGEPGRAEGRVGLPLLAERPEIGPERRLGDGRDPDVDGHPALADLRRDGVRGQAQRPLPQGLYRRGRRMRFRSRWCSAGRNSRNRCSSMSRRCSSARRARPTPRPRPRPTRSRSSPRPRNRARVASRGRRAGRHMSALVARRPLFVMLSPALTLLGVFIAAPMAADDLAVLPGLVDPDRLRRSALRRARQFQRDLRADLGRPRLQAALSSTPPLHAALGRR